MPRPQLLRSLVLLLVCLLSPAALAAAKKKVRKAHPPALKLKAPKRFARVPGGETLRSDAALAFQSMLAAAREVGLFLHANSGYRTLGEQRALYRRFRRGLGPRAARPGRSNHHLGIAVDIPVGGAETSENYAWLAANACRFGFQRTVSAEPWHWEFRPHLTQGPEEGFDCQGQPLAPPVMTEELPPPEAPTPGPPEHLPDAPLRDPLLPRTSLLPTYRV
ncbi:D-alanyl-D-alanine carboxypeptidase family protein [Myxococcaceae bacterium GXIMD 01537]